MTKKAPLFSFKYLLHDIFKWFMSWKCLLFWRIKKIYDTKEAKKKIRGGAVITSNHVAFVDPFVIQGVILYRRFHFIAMDELMKTKFSKWWYKHVFLTQGISRTAPSFRTVSLAGKLVSDGNLVCLFPEGHIKTDEEKVTDEFKGGAILIAYKAKAPIIPIYHEKRKSIWNMTRMVIGKPIYPYEIIGPTLSQDKLKDVSIQLEEYTKYLETLLPKKKQ